MITVEDALKRKLLRAVPVQANGYPEKYKDTPWANYKDFINQDVALVNEPKRFLFEKNKDLAKTTFTAPNGVSLVFIDKADTDVKVNASKFCKVTLTRANLNAGIIDLSSVYNDLLIESFAETAMKVINKEPLTNQQLASLVCDRRVLDVFTAKELLEVIPKEETELFELAKQSTPRARLFRQELKDGATKPISRSLFKSKLIRGAIKLK